MTLPYFERSLFLEGPFGSGKTIAAARTLVALTHAFPDRQALVLVPQLDTASVYRDILISSGVALQPNLITFSSFARKMLWQFWPLVADQLAPGQPLAEPKFLTTETSQYYMSRFATPYVEMGKFDSIYLPQSRLIAQILDNMNKAATSGLTLDEALKRLNTAWGDRLTSRLAVYETAIAISKQYRDFCLANNLFDYSLQVELFNRYLLPIAEFQQYFQTHFHSMIADNIEEMGALAHDFIVWSSNNLEHLVLIFDQDAGYRTFLGADPDNAYELAGICEQQLVLSEPDRHKNARTIRSMQYLFGRSAYDNLHMDGLVLLESVYYPEMLERCVSTICQLVYDQGVDPRQIVILSPFLNDSLRYTLQSRLQDNNIPVQSYRPSRSLYSEPAIEALITCVYLSHPHWEQTLTESNVINALIQLIEGLDPIRAALLAKIVFRNGQLSGFDAINARMQSRIGTEVGKRYERIRLWLQDNTTSAMPIDHYLRRLFDQITQMDSGFKSNLENARLAGALIDAAQEFRQIVYADIENDWNTSAQDFCELLTRGLITSQTLESEPEGIVIMPVYTFLVRNRTVDYQFWLDIGNRGWWERLDQPLTHPYVLRRTFPDNATWTDDMEEKAQELTLHNILVGLLRRCRETAYVGVSALGETGYELSGPLVHVFQQLMSQSEGFGDGE